MGIGSFDGGKFDFVVTASHVMAPAEKAQWQQIFIAASRALYEATEGELSFGRIFIADDGWGLGTCDAALHPENGVSYATLGGYGRLGQSIQLFSSVRAADNAAVIVVHEFGHHAFGLGDEYAGPVRHDTIDTTRSFDEWNAGIYTLVPLLDAANDPAQLGYASAMLVFRGVIERRIVASYDGQLSDGVPPTAGDAADVLRVFAGFNHHPHLAEGNTVYLQPAYDESGAAIRCNVPDAEICLMDHIENAPTISEFCSASNHDPNGDTAHHALHGKSCWEVIQQTMLERYDHAVTIPDPATSGHVDAAYPFFFDVAKEARIALVLDRSGSMSADNKIDGARFGVEQWINAAAQTGDFMSVSWFNESVDTTLPLTEFTDAAAVAEGVHAAIGPGPAGWTNIRDGLFAAIEQVESRDHRAALQAVVLLTDGLHNRPGGSSLLEAVPSLQDAGIAVYVLALGGPETLDLDQLEQLARDTGGAISNVAGLGQSTDPNVQRAVIGIEMARIDGLLRHGLVEVDASNIEGLAPGDPIVRRVRRPGSPALRTILGWYGAADLTTLRRRGEPVTTVRFLVEDGAQRARFTLAHAPKEMFRLVLVDPDGSVVPFDGEQATLVDPESPFMIAFVERPKAGEWTAIIARTSGATASTVHSVAAVDNRHIVTWADCDRNVPTGVPVAISAGARWNDALSNLSVDARLVDPVGHVHRVRLSDDRPGEPGSGEYRGFFEPSLPGRYSGTVSFVCRGDARRAGAFHRATHGSAGAGKDVTVDLTVKAPRFVRRMPIYFDVGGRPVAKDLDGDRAQPRPPIRTRTTRLTPLPQVRIPTGSRTPK